MISELTPWRVKVKVVFCNLSQHFCKLIFTLFCPNFFLKLGVASLYWVLKWLESGENTHTHVKGLKADSVTEQKLVRKIRIWSHLEHILYCLPAM